MIGARIIAEVSAEAGVSPADIVGESRVKHIVAARWKAIWRVRQETGWGFKRIGRLFGDRDHSTISHAIRRMAAGHPCYGEVERLRCEVERLRVENAGLRSELAAYRMERAA